MERTMIRYEHDWEDPDTGEEQQGNPMYTIGGIQVAANSNYMIRVRVPDGSSPGDGLFPICVDCGGSDWDTDKGYDYDVLLCKSCGSLFSVK